MLGAMRGFILLTLISLSAAGYDAPVVTEGPLTIRMQAPAQGSYGAGGFVELSRPGLPMTLPVTLQNSSDREISGELLVRVIDSWTVEPSTPVPFRLRPHGRGRHEFILRFGEKTYNALYPVHAYATFTDQGTRYVAHPILILEPRIPNLPRPKLPADWKPVPVPQGGTLGLWRNPVRRERIDISNQGAEAGRVGREVYDAGSAIHYGPMTGPAPARDGISITLGPRPPALREFIEGASVEYPVALPAVKPLRLEAAIRGDAAFLIEAAPITGGPFQTVLERANLGQTWQTVAANLDRYAGTSIRLRLGARGERGEAQWAEPTLVAGHAPAPPAFPPAGNSRLLGSAGGCEVRLWPGSRGLLDAPIGLICGGRKLYFNGFRVRSTGDDLERWTSSTELVSAREEAAANAVRVRHNFRNWAGSFDVLAELRVAGDALRAKFWLENAPPPKPWFAVTLEAVSLASWSEKALRVYGGPGNVIVNPKAFRLGFDGHNLATSFVGFDFANGQALVVHSDAIPDRLEVEPDTRIYSLVTPHAQTMEVFPASNVFEAVKRIRAEDKRQPSRGVPKLAGRFTFDLWSGRYAESAKALEKAAEYGIRDALVVWHRWQRHGYDYRLPDIYPPNPEFGTLEEFRNLVQTSKRLGHLFAPHDNYIDFYPDFDGFSYSSVVFRQNGTPYKAWFNYGREAQSYRARPDRLKQYVERNVRLLKDGVAPNSYFIDVWSSISPYDYWTSDGKFEPRATTQRVWGEVFAWIRETLGGDAPQLSEAGHDKLIGWLDGADAQQLRVDPTASGFTWRIECEDSERIPWIDVAWHDKFILHGAGYEGRYQGGLDQREHGAYSDDYLSTQVLSGRPAMVPQPFNRDVIRVHWLLNDAMKALALDRIASVEFDGGNIHRQHVKWERGGEVWVNRGAEPWTVAGRTLPQYGFYLKIGAVESAVELKNGKRIEWSQSPAGRYENGRRLSASGALTELP